MSQDFWFLLLPGFSVMGFVSAVEPLRVANRFHADLYRWHVLSADGGPVLASNGMSVNSDGALEPLKKGDLLFVVAGFEPLRAVTPALVQWLRKLDRNGVPLGGIDTGSVVLAEAGLLDGRRATLHWEAIDAFQESYPQLSVTQELFEIDGPRITSAGGTASIDLMLDLIAQAHGPQLAVQVSEQFVLGRIRPRQDHQRLQV
ncbi:HTH-type transcriptional regulator CdhR, partial [Pseudomonas aeruginosa]|nr:HTH-type transcriptional regulator CdhR [Pseudomonas aeruginosa]